KRALEQITAMDGTSNTILAVVADDDRAAIWTKPDDLPFDPDQPLAGLKRQQDQFFAVMADGAVKVFSTSIDPKKAAALFGWKDGEAAESGRAAQAPPGQGGQRGGLLGEFQFSEGLLLELEAAGVDLNKLRHLL